MIASWYCLRLDGGWNSGTLAPPTFLSTLSATVGRCLLVGVPLCLLLRRQDGANLGHLLRANGLTALHHLASLFHIAADSRGVGLLAGRTCRIDEGLRTITQRLILRLVFLTDRLDLGLLRLGQIEITSEAKPFATTAVTTELAISTMTTTVKTAVWTRGLCR